MKPHLCPAPVYSLKYKYETENRNTKKETEKKTSPVPRQCSYKYRNTNMKQKKTPPVPRQCSYKCRNTKMKQKKHHLCLASVGHIRHITTVTVDGIGHLEDVGHSLNDLRIGRCGIVTVFVEIFLFL